MQRGEMVQYVLLLVFVGMFITQGQANNGNEDTHNWNETLHLYNTIKDADILNILDLKDDTSSNPTTEPAAEDTTSFSEPAAEDTSTSIPEPNPLSPGYKPGTEFGSNYIIGYYKFYTQQNKKNWFEAFKTCIKEGSHLVLLNSSPESRAIVGNMAKAGTWGEWHWVGVHDGDKIISRETTESGSIYKCQAVRYDIFSINFGRFDCFQKKSFICEMRTLT